MQILIVILRIVLFPLVCIEVGIRLIFALLKARKYSINPENYPADSRYKTVYILVSRYLFLKGIRIHEKDWENVPKKPVLFVGNHKSNLDALILIQILNKHKEYPLITFVAKKELLSKKIGKILSLIDCVFVDRQNLRQMVESLELQEKQLRTNNVSLGIFPEGTRVPGDTLGEFKGGAIKIAYRTFSPIVPVAIYGTEGKRDKGLASNGKPFNKVLGKDVYVKFLKPLQPINTMNIDSNQTANNIRKQLQITYDQLKTLHENRKNKKKNN